jgi:hypothetical protein
MLSTTKTTKALLWNACRQKTCCHTTRVVINGADVTRIARALELSALDFTLYAPAHPTSVATFRLVAGGEAFEILLTKRQTPETPCVFLWQLADGYQQCGLGALQPLACQVYPNLFVDNLLVVDSQHCSCRRWSLVDMDVARESKLLSDYLTDTADYIKVLNAWNAQLTDQLRSYQDFCDYLLEAYGFFDPEVSKTEKSSLEVT